MSLSRSVPPVTPFFRTALRHGAVAGALVFAGLSAIGEDAPESRAEVWDVGPIFEAEAEIFAGPAGGLAFELDRRHPASLFRLEPSDRRAMANATKGKDYFLESHDIRLGCHASVVDVRAQSAAPADQLVYVLDGNLWLDNHAGLTISLTSTAREVVFVVRGDVTIADDFVVERGTEVTIYALGGEDGRGRIVVGDATYGTLDRVDANLIASGPVEYVGGALGHVEVNGRVASDVPLSLATSVKHAR